MLFPLTLQQYVLGPKIVLGPNRFGTQSERSDEREIHPAFDNPSHKYMETQQVGRSAPPEMTNYGSSPTSK